jgi:hypothetical protein
VQQHHGTSEVLQHSENTVLAELTVITFQKVQQMASSAKFEEQNELLGAAFSVTNGVAVVPHHIRVLRQFLQKGDLTACHCIPLSVLAHNLFQCELLIGPNIVSNPNKGETALVDLPVLDHGAATDRIPAARDQCVPYL